MPIRYLDEEQQPTQATSIRYIDEPAAQPQQPVDDRGFLEKAGDYAMDVGVGLKEGVKRGATFGFGDELQAAVAALYAGGLSPDLTIGQAYEAALGDFRDQYEQARENAGIATGIGEFGGALATGIAATPKAIAGGLANVGAKGFLPRAAAASGVGAASGGLYGYGTGEGGAGQRLQEAKNIGLFGAAGGFGGAAVGAGVGRLSNRVANHIARKRAAKELSQSALQPQALAREIAERQDIVEPVVGGDKAYAKVAKQLKKDLGEDYDVAMQAYKDGNISLIDLNTSRSRTLAQGAAQYPSGKAVAQEYFDPKAAGSYDRVLKSIKDNVSGTEAYYTTADDLLAAGRAKAAPLYDDAYSGLVEMKPKEISGAIGDLQSGQPVKFKYNRNPESSQSFVKGNEFLQDVEPAGRYVTIKSGDFTPDGWETGTIEFKNPIVIDNNNLQWKNQLSEAFGGVKGRDLSDAISKAGHDGIITTDGGYASEIVDLTFMGAGKPQLALPKEVNSAIAKARRQFPSELEGFDDNSVKVLDYAKRVLDDDINTAVRAGKGNLARSRTEVKNNLLDMIDEQVPSYREARRVSGDYLTVNQAMEDGRNALKMDSELLKPTFDALGDVEKEAFQIGVGKAIRDEVGKVAEGANPYKRILDAPEKRKRISSVLSPKQFKNLEADLRAEDRLFKMRNEILGGSPTAGKQEAKNMISSGVGAVDDMAQVPRKTMIAGLKMFFDGLDDKTAGKVSEILYETDPKKKLIILDKIKGAKDFTPREKELVKKAYFETAEQFDVNKARTVGSEIGGATTEIVEED